MIVFSLVYIYIYIFLVFFVTVSALVVNKRIIIIIIIIIIPITAHETCARHHSAAVNYPLDHTDAPSVHTRLAANANNHLHKLINAILDEASMP
jgi:hypothetical protein